MRPPSACGVDHECAGSFDVGTTGRFADDGERPPSAGADFGGGGWCGHQCAGQ